MSVLIFQAGTLQMRVTSDVKTETHRRILRNAVKLFQQDGWDGTTTRKIASAAGIATGTLFNYFPTKEAIAAALITEGLKTAPDAVGGIEPKESSLEADLFKFIWSGLTNLRELRSFLAPACETLFSPLARHSTDRSGDAIRIGHLEFVDTLLTSHGFPGPRSNITLHLYWTLYLGVFAFWAADDSPGQEDTLALLDHSVRLFVSTLGNHQGVLKR